MKTLIQYIQEAKQTNKKFFIASGKCKNSKFFKIKFSNDLDFVEPNSDGTWEYSLSSSLRSMKNMFKDCENLILLNLTDFDTSKITNMHSVFEGCSSLTKLDVSNFNTNKVKDMHSMFDHCSSLTELDLSSFDTGKVKDMGDMFKLCKSLK